MSCLLYLSSAEPGTDKIIICLLIIISHNNWCLGCDMSAKNSVKWQQNGQGPECHKEMQMQTVEVT